MASRPFRPFVSEEGVSEACDGFNECPPPPPSLPLLLCGARSKSSSCSSFSTSSGHLVLPCGLLLLTQRRVSVFPCLVSPHLVSSRLGLACIGLLSCCCWCCSAVSSVASGSIMTIHLASIVPMSIYVFGTSAMKFKRYFRLKSVLDIFQSCFDWKICSPIFYFSIP